MSKFDPNSIYFKQEVKEMEDKGYIESHAKSDHWIPKFEAMKKIYPDLLMIEYGISQYMFRYLSAQKVRAIIFDRREALWEKLKIEVIGLARIDELLMKDENDG